jgi:rod shape-determining protein MreD
VAVNKIKRANNQALFKLSLLTTFGYLFAMYLNLINLPINYPWSLLRPNFLLVFVIFRCYEKPFNINIYFYFFLGLLYDLVSNGILGQTSLSFVVISYLFQAFRIKLYTMNVYILTLFLLAIISVDKLITVWSLYLQGELVYNRITWLSIPVTFVFWITLLLMSRIFGAYNIKKNT